MDDDVGSTPQLHRALGTFDLVLLNVAAIVGLRYLSMAAQIGPSSLALWLLGLVTFLIPAALTRLELLDRESRLLPIAAHLWRGGVPVHPWRHMAQARGQSDLHRYILPRRSLAGDIAQYRRARTRKVAAECRRGGDMGGR